MPESIQAFLASLGGTILWSVVAIIIVVVIFEILDRKYHLMKEIFEENSTAAAVVAGSFVLGVFYTVVQVVIH